MKRSLQVFFVIFGITAITIASMHVVFGPSSAIPGSVPVNATTDSEDRFYATLFAAYGVALLWCVKDVERKTPTVHFLAITFCGGGLARLVSMAAVGLPNSFFVAMTALELLIPFLMASMQVRVSSAAKARLEHRADRKRGEYGSRNVEAASRRDGSRG